MNTIREAEGHGAKFKKIGPRKWVVENPPEGSNLDEVFESKWQAARRYCDHHGLKPTKKAPPWDKGDFGIETEGNA